MKNEWKKLKKFVLSQKLKKFVCHKKKLTKSLFCHVLSNAKTRDVKNVETIALPLETMQ